MTSKRGGLELETGVDAHVRLRAVPRAELRLDAPGLTTLDAVRFPVTLRGRSKNLPDQTPCQVTWLVKPRDGEVALRPGPRVPLKVAGESCSLDLVVNAVELQLVGEGAVGVVVQPLFPHCAPSKVAPARLRYQNLARVRVKGPLRDRVVGEELTLELGNVGAFADVPTRLLVYEDDAYEEPAARGYARRFEFPRAGHVHRWRIGMAVAEVPDEAQDFVNTFDLLDEKELGAYELTAVFELQLAPDGEWVELPGEVVGDDAAPLVRPAHHDPVDVDLMFFEATGYAAGYWRQRGVQVPPELADHLPPASSSFATRPVEPPSIRKPLRSGKAGGEGEPLEKWIYAFKRTEATGAVALVAELSADEDGQLHPVDWGGPLDAARLAKHPNRLVRKAGAAIGEAWNLKFAPDDEAMFFCLSRAQLPYLRLQEYLADPKKVEQRCIRYTHADDPELVTRWLLTRPDEPRRQALVLFDPMRILEELQAQYLDVLQEYEALARGNAPPDVRSGKVVDVELRFLAGITRTVVTALGEAKSKDYVDLASLDSYISTYDRKVAALSQRLDALALLKDLFEYDSPTALDDPLFVGNAYLAAQDDFAAFAAQPPRADLAPEEKQLLGQLIERWLEHKDYVTLHVTTSEVGRERFEARIADTSSWSRVFVESSTWFKVDRTFYRRGVRELPNFLVKVFEARLKALGAEKAVLEGVKLVDNVLKNRMDIGYEGLDLTQALYYKPVGEPGKVKVPVRAGGELVGEFTLPAVTEAEARTLAKHLSEQFDPARRRADLKTVTDRIEKTTQRVAMVKGALQRVTILIEFVNIWVAAESIRELVATGKHKKYTALKWAQLVTGLAKDLANFVSALEVLSIGMTKEQLATTFGKRLGRTVKVAGIAGSILNYVTEALYAYDASSKGNYGKALGHGLAATGAAFVLGGTLAATGASIFGMSALAATGVGLVLLLGGAVIVYFFTEAPPEPAQRWLDACAWGRQKIEKKVVSLPDQFQGAIELIGAPRVHVVALSSPRPRLRVALYPAFWEERQTRYRITSLRLMDGKGYTAWFVNGPAKPIDDRVDLRGEPVVVDGYHEEPGKGGSPTEADVIVYYQDAPDDLASAYIRKPFEFGRVRWELQVSVRFLGNWEYTKPYLHGGELWPLFADEEEWPTPRT